MKELPADDKHARPILLTGDQYVIIDECTLPLPFSSNYMNKVKEVIRQLVVPKYLRGDILEYYHMQNGHIGMDKIMFTISYTDSICMQQYKNTLSHALGVIMHNVISLIVQICN